MNDHFYRSFCSQFNYSGKILAKSFSQGLKTRIAQAIINFHAIEQVGTPIIPYIAAWQTNGSYIWYEYTGKGLRKLLGYHTAELADAFRENIINRCLYRRQGNPTTITKVIRDRDQLERMRKSLRRTAERGGGSEAIYKINVNDNPLWLKDLAKIEVHENDGIVLSYGSLTDVSKEMRLEERLNELQDQLQFHKRNLEWLVEERTKDLKTAQLEIVTRLTEAAACRDDKTGLHSKRMSNYCAILSKAYGLPKGAKWLLRHAVPMHDVGKIGVSDAILLKEGPLTADEFEVIKEHCQMGANLLSGGSSQLLEVARVIALTHHERWDGSGYPQGLAGRDIPLASRIAAICDVFDALTSDRPYKLAWGFEDATQEIKRLRDIHFDPQLVDLFLENLGEIHGVYRQHMPPSFAENRPQPSAGQAPLYESLDR